MVTLMGSERRTGRTTRMAEVAVAAAAEGKRVIIVMLPGGHGYLGDILVRLGARQTDNKRFAIADGTIELFVARDPKLARVQAGTENTELFTDHAVWGG